MNYVTAVDRPERIVASLIDYFLIAIMMFMPPIGTVMGTLYFFMRDALPFGYESSVGKSIYGFRVVSREGDEQLPLAWYKSIIRNFMILIPGINIVDFYTFMRYGYRSSDRWFGIEVVRKKVEDETA